MTMCPHNVNETFAMPVQLAEDFTAHPRVLILMAASFKAKIALVAEYRHISRIR